MRQFHRADRTPAGRLRTGQLLVLATVLASYGFWQFSAPLLRYGYAYILLVVMITSGILCDYLIKSFDKRQKKDMIRKTVVFGMVVLWGFSAVKLVSLARYMYGESGKKAYVWQQDYGRYALERYEAGGVTFYYPADGDRTGYEHVPSIPRQAPVLFRGDSVGDGFYPKSEN